MKKEEEQKLEEEKARLTQLFASESKEYIIEPVTEDGGYLRFISSEGLKHIIELKDNLNHLQNFLFIMLYENKLAHLLSQKEFELIVHIIGHVRDFYLERERSSEELCLILNFYLNVFFTNIERTIRQSITERAGKTFEDLFGASPIDYVSISTRIKQKEFDDLLNYADTFKECPFASAEKPLGILGFRSQSDLCEFYIAFMEKYREKFDVTIDYQFTQDFSTLLLSFVSLYFYYLSYDQDQEIVKETKIIERPMVQTQYAGLGTSRFPLQSLINYQSKKEVVAKCEINIKTEKQDEHATEDPENEWGDLTEEEIKGIKLKLEEARENLQKEYEAKLAALNTKKPRK